MITFAILYAQLIKNTVVVVFWLEPAIRSAQPVEHCASVMVVVGLSPTMGAIFICSICALETGIVSSVGRVLVLWRSWVQAQFWAHFFLRCYFIVDSIARHQPVNQHGSSVLNLKVVYVGSDQMAQLHMLMITYIA